MEEKKYRYSDWYKSKSGRKNILIALAFSLLKPKKRKKYYE
jgi:hypothetical protein